MFWDRPAAAIGNGTAALIVTTTAKLWGIALSILRFTHYCAGRCGLDVSVPIMHCRELRIATSEDKNCDGLSHIVLKPDAGKRMRARSE